MAADFQNQFPNPCALSNSGYFGSKFVTVCVSGNETNQISLKGYQVGSKDIFKLWQWPRPRPSFYFVCWEGLVRNGPLASIN